MRKELERLEAAGDRLAKILRSRRSSDRRAARAGIETPRAAQDVLRYVIEGGPARVSEIARTSGSGEPAVSRLVSQLERQGLLERVPDRVDRRAALVRATRSGQAAAHRLRQAADEIFEEHMAAWRRPDVEQLAELLERFCRDLAREK